MLDIVDSEVKELEQDIKNMEEELKEIEETYGVKTESSWIESEESWGKPEAKTSGRKDKKFKKKPTTLKEYHEQAVQELWDKDKTRWEIFKLLDEIEWIDKDSWDEALIEDSDKLKKDIKEAISKKFFEYYDEKRWGLRLRSARHVKNMLRDREKRIGEIEDMPEWEEREQKIRELEEEEKVYYWESKLKKIIEFSEKLWVKLKDFKDCWKIWKKPLSQVKNDSWRDYMYRWDDCLNAWNWSEEEIKDIQNIWDKLLFQILIRMRKKM